MGAVTVDSQRERLTLHVQGQVLTVRGKAVELVCLLLVRECWVTADEVHGLPAWQGMSRGSVGKQVARLIDSFIQQGLDLLEWKNKTSEWCLKQAARATLDERTPSAAAALLESRQAGASGGDMPANSGEVAECRLSPGSNICACFKESEGQGGALYGRSGFEKQCGEAAKAGPLTFPLRIHPSLAARECVGATVGGRVRVSVGSSPLLDPWLIFAEENIGGDDELSNDGSCGDLGGLSSGDERLISGFQGGVEAGCDDGWLV